MSEELKCPCCGGEASDFEQTGIVECEECMFMCYINDFPRIAAAMDLARAEASASNAVWSVPLERLEPAVEASEDMLFQAKMRVLEVFGCE